MPRHPAAGLGADARDVRLFAETAEAQIKATDDARVRIHQRVLDEDTGPVAQLADHYHPLGMRRMSAAPALGAVHADCRVHAIARRLRGEQCRFADRWILGSDNDDHRPGDPPLRSPAIADSAGNACERTDRSHATDPIVSPASGCLPAGLPCPCAALATSFTQRPTGERMSDNRRRRTNIPSRRTPPKISDERRRRREAKLTIVCATFRRPRNCVATRSNATGYSDFLVLGPVCR